MSFVKDAIISKSVDVEEYTLEDGNIVLFKKNPQYTHVLNDTAAFLWTECDKKSFNDTVALFTSSIDNKPVDENEIIRDCEELFEDMLTKGLITLEK